MTLPTAPERQAPPPVAPADGKLPRSFILDAAGAFRRDVPLKDLAASAGDATSHVWVDIDSASRQQFALLEKVFHFHPLSIEDVLNPNSRAKVEPYDGYLFVILRVVRYHQETADPYDLATANLCFFLGANFLVTVHNGVSEAVDAVMDVTLRNPDFLARGPARLAHQVMDGAVDQFFPILDRIDEFTDQLEERVFHSFDEQALHDIFAVKRMVLQLRRYLSPEREIFNVLTNRPSHLLSTDAQLYFRDIYDHILRINDSLDTYRDLLSSTLESYLSQVSNRLGSITKGLSVIATLSVPFVVVSGMWGMNFARIPLSQWRWGFEAMLVLQLALGGGLVWWLRRRRTI